jgi:hypothetical protein
VKYIKAIMNHEEPFTEEVYCGILKLRAFENPNTKKLSPFTSPVAYATGWEIYYYQGFMVVNHDGCIAGSATRHFFLPDIRFGGAVFGNAADGAGIVAAVLSQELIDEVLNVPAAERLDWNQIETMLQAGEVSAKERRLREADEERQILCPGIKEPEPQMTPLDAYLGHYWNAGYYRITVQVKDDRLFIDASDRSTPFTLAFEHVCGQTKYVLWMKDYFDGYEVAYRAEFRFEEGKALQIGLCLEEELEELIWFDKVHDDHVYNYNSAERHADCSIKAVFESSNRVLQKPSSLLLLR